MNVCEKCGHIGQSDCTCQAQLDYLQHATKAGPAVPLSPTMQEAMERAFPRADSPFAGRLSGPDTRAPAGAQERAPHPADWAAYHEWLESTRDVEMANLVSALVADGHTPDCPVVQGASVDCVPGGGCTARLAPQPQADRAALVEIAKRLDRAVVGSLGSKWHNVPVSLLLSRDEAEVLARALSAPAEATERPAQGEALRRIADAITGFLASDDSEDEPESTIVLLGEMRDEARRALGGSAAQQGEGA